MTDTVIVKIKNVPRLGKIWVGAIPCIKTSNNIQETNDGITTTSCFVQEDREVFVEGLTPENDPFFYEDNEKRVFGETEVTLRT